MNNSYFKFAKDNVLIGITTLFITLSNTFILLPLFTKRLGVYNYGLWNQVNITVGLITVLISFGLPVSMVRFLASRSDKTKIKEDFYSIITTVLISSVIIGFILYNFSDRIAVLIFDGNTVVLKITILIIIVWTLDVIYLSYFRARREMLLYSIFSIIYTSVEIIIVSCVVLTKANFLYVLISFLMAKMLFLFILSTIVSYKIGLPKFNFSRTYAYIRFGLPTIMTSLSSWIIASSDRYIIGYILGATHVGFYSVCYYFGNVPVMFARILVFVLAPTLSKLYDERQIDIVKVYLSYSLKYFLLIAIPFIFGAIVFSFPVLEIFSTAEIASNGYYIVPLISMSALLYGSSLIGTQILMLKKRTKTIGGIWIFASLVNLLLNLLFIPRLQILGAALATVVAYFTALILLFYYSFREMRFKIDWRLIGKSLFATSVMIFVSSFINRFMNVPVFGVIIFAILMYGAVLYLLKGFHKNEVEFFKRLCYVSLNKT